MTIANNDAQRRKKTVEKQLKRRAETVIFPG